MRSHSNEHDKPDLGPYADLLRRSLPGPDQIAARALRRRRARSGAIAAGVVVVLVGVLAADPAYYRTTLATQAAPATWTLADGSEVTLNRNSRVSVSLHPRSRQLVLDQGEAVFEVSHSPLRSFVVKTSNAEVEDIGTVFNVRLDDAATDVAVVQGAVRVLGAGDAAVLSANQAARVSTAGVEVNTQVNAAYLTAWRRGKLVFDDTPLVEVARQLERYGSPPIAFEDAAARAIGISGQFDIARIDALVDLLPTIAGVRTRRDARGTVIISSRR